MISCFVDKVIRDLELIDHLFINPIRRGLSIGIISSELYKLMFYLTIVTNYFVTVTFGWHDSRLSPQLAFVW